VNAAVIQWRRSPERQTTAVRIDISSQREAPGHAVGLRSGTARSSCCWRSAAHRGDRAELGQRRGGVARAEENQKREIFCIKGLLLLKNYT
jgi:hypothetical protein